MSAHGDFLEWLVCLIGGLAFFVVVFGLAIAVGTVLYYKDGTGPYYQPPAAASPS
jgi:hypothetical protein